VTAKEKKFGRWIRTKRREKCWSQKEVIWFLHNNGCLHWNDVSESEAIKRLSLAERGMRRLNWLQARELVFGALGVPYGELEKAYPGNQLAKPTKVKKIEFPPSVR